MFWRFSALFMLIVVTFGLNACAAGEKARDISAAEWADLKAYDFSGNFKKLSGLGGADVEANDYGTYAEYCTGPEWANGRRLSVSGLSEENIAYGGCLLEEPLPYEPQRLHGRPY